MKHLLANCGDGVCNCYKMSLDGRLLFNGFPKETPHTSRKKYGFYIWNGRFYELVAGITKEDFWYERSSSINWSTNS